MNIVVLRGVLSSPPRTKRLPSGTELVNWEITTPAADGKVSVPVSWFDPPATARSFEAGAEVVVVGVVRRRFYRTGHGTASATDVHAVAACAASRPRSVKKLVDRVVSALEPDGEAARDQAIGHSRRHGIAGAELLERLRLVVADRVGQPSRPLELGIGDPFDQG